MDLTLEELKQFSYLENFPKPILERLLSLSRKMKFDPGAYILRQGDLNSSLYFLIHGTVQIIVDQETIFTLSHQGEVLGEMSLVSHKPISASVRAVTEVEVMIIDSSFLKWDTDSGPEVALLNKVIASVLSERLRVTNEKARQHEIMNRELENIVKERTSALEKSLAQLEVQNTTLVTGFRALEEQENKRKTSLGRIQSIGERALPMLKATVQSLKSQASTEEQRRQVEEAQREVDGIHLEIMGLEKLFVTEAALDKKRVLLLESEKKNQMVTKMALGGTGVGLQIASDVPTAESLLREHKFDLILSDASFGDFLASAHALHPTLPVALMIEGPVESYLDTLQKLDFVSHVVSRDSSERSLTVKTIVTTINKVLTLDFLGLEKYLSWGVDIHEFTLRKSSERADAIDQMRSILKAIGLRNSILDRCAIVAEEQLMNAIYDAPVDSNGRSLFNHLPRSEIVELAEHQAAKFRFACDGNFIAISVQDPFGSLRREVIYKYLKSCYTDQAGQLQENKGGAGRGLHQIIENSDLTVFNVQSKKVSEVISLFQVDAKDGASSLASTLHYFFF